MSSKPGNDLRVRLTIVALPSEVPAIIRLSRVLKGLLRGFQFRCVCVEPDPETPGAPPVGAAEGSQ